MSAFRPLTVEQRPAADALVSAGQLRTAPVDEPRAQSFLLQAADELAALPSLA